MLRLMGSQRVGHDGETEVNEVTRVLERGEDTQTTQGRSLCKDGGRDRCSAGTSRGTPQSPETGRSKEGCSSRALRKHSCAETLISAFRPLEL